MMSKGRLADKTAIVTGGGRGIGRAISILFAEEGANVGVLDLIREEIEESLFLMSTNNSAKHCAIVADVSSAEQVKNAFKELEEKLGEKCTVLVNNAGIVQHCHVDDTSEVDFDNVIETNLKGTFFMCNKFVTSLDEVTNTENNERGVIVNISSIAGKIGHLFTGYSASKAGVMGLTKSIAVGYPKHRVRCNAVLPGVIDTPMMAGVGEQMLAEVLKTVPMRRIGKPEDVAKPCLFLSSDESSYMNGICMEVTGGMGM